MDSGKRIGDIFTNKNGQFGLAVGDAVYSVGTDGVLKEVINGVVSLKMLLGFTKQLSQHDLLICQA